MTDVNLATFGGINLGDVVSLKSGGPKMTVEGFEQGPLPAGALAGTPVVTLIKCIWFNEAGAFGFRAFSAEVLEGGSGTAPVAAAA